MTTTPGRPDHHHAGRHHDTRWTLDPVVGLCAAAAILIAGAGLLLGRPQMIALALPLALTAAWAYPQRPVGAVTMTATTDRTTVRSRTLTLTVDIHTPPAVTAVHLRADTPGAPTVDALVAVPPASTRTLELVTPSVRTGPRELFTLDLIGLSPQGAWHNGPHHHPSDTVLVLPAVRRLDTVPVSTRLRGLTGPHSSRRLGDGTEMRDIATFRPGDSVRRVDWRTTARRSPDTSTLYVRRTFAVSEASVVLVLDSRDDMAPDVSSWGGHRPAAPTAQTSLDIAREAAATIATAVIDGGDRLGFEDLGSLRSPLSLSGGRRHLDRVVYAMTLARPRGAPRTRERPPQVPAGAMIYIFSTFLDDSAATITLQWVARGHEVIAVDTLPREDLSQLSPRETSAWKLSDIRRRDRINTLHRAGVTLLRWSTDDAHALLRTHVRTRQAHR